MTQVYNSIIIQNFDMYLHSLQTFDMLSDYFKNYLYESKLEIFLTNKSEEKMIIKNDQMLNSIY